MSDEKPVSIKDLKKGSYVIIDGEPCRIVNISFSKPGKHGAAKARVEAIGLFDSKRRSVVKPADSTLIVPIILKRNAQVVSVEKNEVQLMDLEDYNIFYTTIPEEFKGKLNVGDEVHYWKIKDKSVIKQKK